MAFMDKMKDMIGMGQQKPSAGLPGEPMFDDEIASYVEDEYQRRQSERKAFELQWRLNGEFINGNQYLDINTKTNSLQEVPKINWWSEREVFNQIATIQETRIARLSTQKPILKTRPASNEDGDMSAAKVSSSLLSSTWYDQDMDTLYNSLIAWLELCGTVLVKPIWNKDKGRLIDRQMVEDPEASAENAEEQEGENRIKTDKHDTELGIDQQMQELREGDIETAVVPAFEFFPDSSYRDGMEHVRSAIHARAYHVDDIQDMWGVKVEAEKVDVMTLQQTKNGAGGVGYSAGSYHGATKPLENHAVIKEYYERPSKRYPQGRFIVVAGGKTLHVGVLPYQIGKDGEPELPFVRFVCVPKPGVFWGGTIVERCLPIQRRYNALRNRIAEYLNMVTIGQWNVQEGSMDDDSQLNNAPGSIRYYKVGFAPPEPVQFPPLPSSFENEISTLLSEFTAVSGVSELSRYSEAPSGVKSGVALSIANEQDNTRISMTSTGIANGIVDLGKFWLRLYRQFAQEPRLVRSIGKNDEVDVIEWNASDLKSDDVVIDNTAALSESPAQRRQMVFDLIGTGIFNREDQNPYSEEGIQKIMEMIDMGHWELGMQDDRKLQQMRAKREQKNLIQGMPQQVEDFDDHALHLEQHNRFRMSADYEALKMNPMAQPIVMLFEQHIFEHYHAQQLEVQQQAMQQMMMQSGGMLPPINQEAPMEEGPTGPEEGGEI